jgi:mannose-6-phosphate isomerase-like protein (cupin superfamily)
MVTLSVSVVVQLQANKEMTKPVRSCVIRLADARARIPSADGGHAASLLQRATLNVKLSQPVPPNQQTPHAQDELYIIVRGSGVLFHDGKRDRVEAGDLMFVAAGTEHRFEDFTEDLSVWVVFYGPDGGEVPDQ